MSSGKKLCYGSGIATHPKSGTFTPRSKKKVKKAGAKARKVQLVTASAEMSSVRKLREGAYLVHLADNVHDSTKREILLNLNGSSLSCVFRHHYDSKTTATHLELEFLAKKLSNDLKCRSVLAIKNGKHNDMILKKNVWKTSWPFERCCQYSYDSNGSSHPTPFYIEVFIDFPEIKRGEKVLLSHLSALVKNDSLADVTFQVKDVTLKAHSVILAAGSPVLAAMLQTNSAKNTDQVIEIKNAEPVVFKQFLEYLYTGKASELEKDNMAEALLVLSNVYNVKTLNEECASELARQLRVENATRTLILAHHNSSPNLYESALHYISKNGKAICSRADWLDLMKTYPELSFQATQLMLAF